MRKEFNVWFKDVDGGMNHKILEADSVMQVMVHLRDEGILNNVVKIERR